MGKLTKSIGFAATTAWLLLAILTAGSGVLDFGLLEVSFCAGPVTGSLLSSFHCHPCS
jgi:hypothetical protein